MEFERKPTDPDRIVERVPLPEGEAILIANAPDYVNLPSELMERFGISTRRVNVVRAIYRDLNGQSLLHYELDMKIEGKTLWVAKGTQFYWHLR